MDGGVEVEEIDIVIVGAGICGLATALLFTEILRASGSAIGVLANGWRALDQLGVGSKLRQTALPLQGARHIWMDTNEQRTFPISKGERRCVKRSDLLQVLAEDLPIGTIRYGCPVLSLYLDPFTSYPTLQLRNGPTIKAKIVIGCDGAKSVVAEFLKLKPNKLFPKCAVRVLTSYPNEHGFVPEFVRTYRGHVFCGRAPINENLVYWFLDPPEFPPDEKVYKDPELIRHMCLEKANGFPNEIITTIQNSDPNHLSLTHLTYRAPWDVLVASFREGTVTVAGDAMHVMGPFLGQGGSAALEDGVVLARCLAYKIGEADLHGSYGRLIVQQKVGEAMDAYVRERRMRLVGLSAQTYLTGLLQLTSLMPLKLFIKFLMAVFFPDPVGHTRYDCGRL
ncbi:hypothetical protein FNV43_RR14771 [Rhamnella rubrinervis]|uniref:FAD-binding domain-containing protein n=1 Tax=Rhamnella rubrinervis TaxID=2594499 RepID=A0A8K0H3Y5_9ROSA|nr:hypothetical protein FNV43_RR14771 [Rhamnella rubrinervis]